MSSSSILFYPVLVEPAALPFPERLAHALDDFDRQNEAELMVAAERHQAAER
jgi:hypothetical protein